MAGDFGTAAGVLAASGGTMWGGVPAATWINAGSSVLGAAMGKPAAPNYSSAASSQDVRQSFDFGNWTVSTGGSEAQGGTSGLDLSALFQSPLLLLGLAAIGVVAWKHRKS